MTVMVDDSKLMIDDDYLTVDIVILMVDVGYWLFEMVNDSPELPFGNHDRS